EAGIRQADHFGARRLRLQQEGRIVRGRKRVANGADNRAALGLDEVGRLLLQRIAEGVVGGEEEPGVAALADERAARADGQRMRVIGPMEAVWRACLAG